MLSEVACPLCGARSRRTRYRGLALAGATTGLHRCARCGVHYVSPRPTGAELERQYRDPDEQERYYREEYAPIVPAVTRHTDRTIRLLEAHQAPGTLLDYGGGAGVMAAAAARRGWRALGYDVSPAAARWGRELLGTEILDRLDAVRASPLAPFDAVAVVEVVEHVERPVELLREALSLLRPGGTLVVSTPNFASLARRRAGAAWGPIIPAAHIALYDPATLRRLLRAAGAEPLRVLTWWNELGRLPAPLRRLPWLRDPPGGHALLAFARAA